MFCSESKVSGFSVYCLATTPVIRGEGEGDGMGQLVLTEHARMRLGARRIPTTAVEMTLLFGRENHVRGATLYAAEALGVSDRGSVAPGTLADLIAVPGNPLEDERVLENVVFAMKGGVVVKGPPTQLRPNAEGTEPL